EDQVDQRELESLRENWAIEHEEKPREAETPDDDSDEQGQAADGAAASRDSRDGGDRALEGLRRRWQSEYEQAEREAQAQAAKESEELQRRWDAEHEQLTRQLKAQATKENEELRRGFAA